MAQEFYNPVELGQRLRVGVGTLVRWRKDGTGPAWTLIGRKVMYRVEEVEKWLASRTTGKTA